jgi:hypothetical protein
VSSLYRKIISGKPYYYLREMGWVDGKPKMVSERYLGSVADIVAAMDRVEAAMMPLHTGHLKFGAVAAGWSMLTELDVVAVIDELIGARLKARRAGHQLSVKAILDTLAGIEETIMVYPSTGGRPKARRQTTDMTGDQQALYDLFTLHRWAPATT